MEFIQELHMNGGGGETSYAQNSIVQKKILSYENPSIQEAISAILSCKNNFPVSMGIADLGCSSGPNTLMLISEVIDIVNSRSTKMGISMPELRVYLNDLPGNDFNDIFLSLPEFYRKQELEKGKRFNKSCFVACVGGSFYCRLFPKRSLHFVHSSSGLHWLSKVPPLLDSNASEHLNKGKIYISKTSSESVRNAYLQQFRSDFSSFLKSRSEEVVLGGRMVLSFLGRMTTDPTTEDCCYQWELLANALQTLVSEGRIEEDKLNSFNAPYYAPSVEEVRNEIEKEGSFVINSLKAIEVPWDAGYRSDRDNKYTELTSEEYSPTTSTTGGRVAKTIRAVVESMFESQFGKEIMDDLFIKFAQLVDDYSLRAEPKYIDLVISVTRKYE
ncbi:OLC1v1018033C1 [Oldenlandia corymbosa var. corymbosa]|uniref:OLC1v1018033C1 n=1 Tax=Oldenlandia corymbosa var. corymbosa TaxID=529605 RepID=A0AAV1EAT6_OLDCO|nr:OLC1v1018033C1 [Oldenlandia corymbosa var. corymbosa]